jgi:hypothetical protein
MMMIFRSERDSTRHSAQHVLGGTRSCNENHLEGDEGFESTTAADS